MILTFISFLIEVFRNEMYYVETSLRIAFLNMCSGVCIE